MKYLNKQQIEKIIEDNVGLIRAQMHKLHVGYDDDAYSYGLEGLYNAIMTYESDKKIAFTTYATVCIYNNICMYLRKRTKAIDKVTVSYDTTIDEKGTSFLDLLEDDLNIEQDIIADDAARNIIAFIEKARDNERNEIVKQVLDIWINSGFTATNTEIAKRVGCAQSYVSRIICNFRKRLKIYLMSKC